SNRSRKRPIMQACLWRCNARQRIAARVRSCVRSHSMRETPAVLAALRRGSCRTPVETRRMAQLIVCPPRRVERAWIDYNGHMNMAFYNLVFDQALDSVFDQLGIGAEYVRSRHASVFTAEIHVHYLDELTLGDPLRLTFQLLDWDDKRLHYYEEM